MNPLFSPCRRLVGYALLIGNLGLIAAVCPGQAAGGKKAKTDAKAAAKQVEAIVSPNKPPTIVDRVARFPKDYDWKRQKQVYQALFKLHQNTSVELWEELVRRSKDRRYSLTVRSEQTRDSENKTVGVVGSVLAYERLIGVFQKHMPADPGHDGFQLRLHDRIDDLQKWRKDRKDQALFQLQIEVCERALKELQKVKRISKAKKRAARKKIKAEIKKLRRTKRPIIYPSNPFDGIWPPYSGWVGK
jgi:hypothetical protein